MSEWIQRLIESKRAHRAKLAGLSFEEKVRLLEKLRDRTRMIQAGRGKGMEGNQLSSEFGLLTEIPEKG
jgi:hypothetical protein